MDEKGKDNSRNSYDDDILFGFFLRMILRNSEITRMAFTHDLEPQRQRFITMIRAILRDMDEKKEGDE